MIAVIGGTSGIGLETVTYLRDQGKRAIACARNNSSHDSDYRYVDVTDENSVKNLIEPMTELNSLVYSTGITTKQKPIGEFDSKIWEDIVSVNVTGAMYVLKYAYKYLSKNKGKVVIVNSFAARTYSMFSGVEYTMSKNALTGLVRQLSVDFAKDGVMINSIFPSMTATKMLLDNADTVFLDKVTESIPLKRLASPSDVAKAIAFLISDDNTYMTGCGLDLNGGQFLNG